MTETVASPKRGKRVGPSNVEAKRAAALRQAASAATAERHAHGLANTATILQFIRDAAISGTIPSNDSLLTTFEAWLHSVALAPEGLSPTGARLVTDLKGLLELLMRLLRERNGDELIQRFMHHVHLAGRVAGMDVAVAAWRARGRAKRQQRALTSGGRGKISIWKSEAKRQQVFICGEHSRIAGIDAARREPPLPSEERVKRSVVKDARALLRILQQIVISADFRQLLLRIQRVAHRIVDSSQESDDDGGLGLGPGFYAEEKERIEDADDADDVGDADDTRDTRDAHATQDTSSQLYGIVHSTIEETSPAIEGYTERRLPIFTFDATKHLPIVDAEGDNREKENEPQSSNLAPSANQDILQEMRGIFEMLSRNSAFSRALRDFYFVLLRMRAKIDPIATTASDDPAGRLIISDLRYDANFRAAQEELLSLLERFAGGVPLTPVIDSLRRLRTETKDDYALRDFFGDWRAFLKRCTGPDSVKYLDSREYSSRGDFLLRRTRSYFRPKGQYRSHIDEAYDGLNRFSDGIRRDELTRQLGQQVSKLVKEDLIGVAQGERISLRTLLSTSSMLRPDLLNDIRFHILPKVLRAMQSIPLPRIEVVSGGTVLVLEDLIIPADALVPMQVELVTASHVTMNPKARLFRRSSTPSPSQSGLKRVEGVEGSVQLKLTAIAGQVRNVRFTLDRHEGWPQFTDQGLADLRIDGRGLSILVDLVSHPASEVSGRSDLRGSLLPAALIAHRVRVRIDRLALTLHDSLHDSIYRVFNPLIGSVVKRQMEQAIRTQIINIVDSVDGLLDRLSQSVSTH